MSRYSFTHTVSASPEHVWGEVSDHEGMAGWTPQRLPLPKVTLEQEGTGHRNGVGAIRRITLAGPPIRERITAFEPGKLLAYEALSGVPAKSYTGEIVLEPVGSGTRFTWTIDFQPAFPGAQVVLKLAIGTLARVLARRCNR
ncbi:SRPBCC family protein [Rhodococcus sp. X156]|uniref:SRPBCC family protein n=1 Tax=Rhodococcus sp. X156 TaxID=2499145 RepID=UPI000FD71F2D|nr:SRPBCC family protein [Rhodococcus sp. X156]